MMLNIVPTKQEAVCPQQVPVTMETAPSTDYNKITRTWVVALFVSLHSLDE